MTLQNIGKAHLVSMPGLEADNLLAFLALMGLLRSLEASRREWNPRAFWKGPPWIAQLSVAEPSSTEAVAHASAEGVRLIAADFDSDHRKNVDFSPVEYGNYVTRLRSQKNSATLASALSAECVSRNDRPPTALLVMMFGQGHQFFLERLLAATCEINKADQKMSEALFQPWRRDDDSNGFRWDPQEDQRYALRYGNPSKAGAALTVEGANRLAAIGFLSFSTVAREQRIRAAGSVYQDGDWYFVWPIWTRPFSRACIEALLNHPDVLAGKLTKVRGLGVGQIFRARRVANGKYMNVTRAQPAEV
jgi:hypothetical protein